MCQNQGPKVRLTADDIVMLDDGAVCTILTYDVRLVVQDPRHRERSTHDRLSVAYRHLVDCAG